MLNPAGFRQRAPCELGDALSTSPRGTESYYNDSRFVTHSRIFDGMEVCVMIPSRIPRGGDTNISPTGDTPMDPLN